ncbi:MAG: beta-lactamase family protein, partial [Proteobacteria bacterium]|nr:beta-lactamase family protein [Pseudomonadota bacterium]
EIGNSNIRWISLFVGLIIVFCLGCSQLGSQVGADSSPAVELPRAKPETVGMSSETLSEIKPAVQDFLDRKWIAGAVTLVARKGEVVYFDAMGFRDVENQAPMKTDTIFRIYSMTKPIASVALMILYDEGHFRLDDPISKWLPEFSNPVVAVGRTVNQDGKTVIQTEPAARPITVRHILTHTAGLSNSYMGEFTPKAYRKAQRKSSREDTIGDMVKRYAAVPLNYHPGDEWQYSRATCVVGRLVEVISGRTLAEFMRERIFKPLQMVDTSFFLPMEKLPRFAANYSPGVGRRITLIDPASSDSGFVKKPHVYFSGSGGLLSTATDYVRFCQMMLNKGELEGTRILKTETVALMTENHVGELPLWLSPGAQFGLGFALNPVDSDTGGAAGTYSWGGAAYTKFWIDPQREMIGILMTQVLPNNHLSLHTRFSTLANRALLGTGLAPDQSEGLGTEFTYDKIPKFTISYPQGTTRDKIRPGQVLAAKTPAGVTFQATVSDIPQDLKLEDVAQKWYVPILESIGIALNPKVVANAEFVLADGSKAYKSEIHWIYKPMNVRLMTQMMAAYKNDRLVTVTAHPYSDKEEVIPIIESLRFGPVVSRSLSSEGGKETEATVATKPEVLNTPTYEYNAKPAFSFRFPSDSTRAQTVAPGQVMAGRTPDRVNFYAAVNEIPEGMDLSEVGPAVYAANLEKTGAGSEVEVVSNREIKLECGTRAYLTEIDWLNQRNWLITTQVVSAFKNGKWIRVSVLSGQFSWEYTPIVKSLKFKDP